MKKAILFTVVFTFFPYCDHVFQKNEIITGIEEIKNQNGSILLIATAKASEDSIGKGMISLMRTTSCDAAKILLKSKIEQLKPGTNPGEYSFNEMELLENGIYCRIRILLVKEK